MSQFLVWNVPLRYFVLWLSLNFSQGMPEFIPQGATVPQAVIDFFRRLPAQLQPLQPAQAGDGAVAGHIVIP